MLSSNEYMQLSLELNLFFLRIVKEHNFFLAVSLPPKAAPISMQLVSMNRNLDRLLSRVISLSEGNISREVMTNGELVTNLTLPAERAAQSLTGVPIDTSITLKEMNLGYRKYYNANKTLESISVLNKDILAMVREVIDFQNNMLNQVLSCKAFVYMYPSNLKHVIEEAYVYVKLLTKIENRQGKDITLKELIEEEIFWNHIMEEHSEFIRGYLDPSEKKLFEVADHFVDEFDKLEDDTKKLLSNPNNINQITRRSYNLVTELRNFKKQGTEGLLLCKIKAIMPALLGDHVTREANHYLRILSDSKKF
ncbi:DUF2935 domain-containing protein [Hathewaya massiliensis]|uniref:DUF2935 domain-containing protein n=1 Tax=Hathewaya massiliensis TaxID=1964382 RepID=UPI00115AC859|nr:DUF2935 domain-containing protein [Hathewaya massiliensis]